jgi:branched-chain amino acid transport system substrate-binding protein
MKFRTRLITAGAIAALLASAGFGRAVAVAADPVEVPVVISQTGQGAFLGAQLKQGMQLAEELTNKNGGINGRPLKLVFYDDQTNPQVAIQLFNGFAAKHNGVVLGPAFTAPCLAAAQIVLSNGPVELCSSPALHPTHGSYLFSMTPGVNDDIAVMVRYFRLHGWNRIGLITSADATGQDVERELGNVLNLPENRALKLVESDRFALADINVGAQMARLRTANCDAIIAWTTGAPWGTLLHGINDAGLTVPIAGSPGDMVNGQMEQFASILPKTLIFPGLNGMVRNALRPGPVLDAQKAYYASLDGAHVRGDFGVLIPWDATMIVVNALRHFGADATPDQVRSYILGLHGWSGVEGVYDFGDREQRGVGQNALFVASWDTSKKNWIALSRPGGYLK